jgi:hypothetical protein
MARKKRNIICWLSMECDSAIAEILFRSIFFLVDGANITQGFDGGLSRESRRR